VLKYLQDSNIHDNKYGVCLLDVKYLGGRMKARIEILGDITLGYAARILSTIISANNDRDVDKIILWISSEDGSPEVITLFNEIIKMCTKPVYAVGALKVHKVAASIFMMATKRVLFPGTSFQICRFSNDKQTIGFSDVKSDNEEISTTYWEPIIENSSITLETLAEKCDSEWNLTNEELISFNVVTNTYNREEVKSWIMEEAEKNSDFET
jgi:ATP-dependent protease ClpP protease subunit